MSAFITLRSSSAFWPSLSHLARSLRAPVISTVHNTTGRLSANGSDVASTTNLTPLVTASPFSLPGDVAVALPVVNGGSLLQNNPFMNSVGGAMTGKQDLVSQAVLMAETDSNEVEVLAYECPAVVRRDVESLFPNQSIPWPMNAVTIAQHTNNDMVTWSAAVAEEREILTAQLVSTATSLCRTLQAEGYFADFIDPSSGRPFLSKDYTPATLFETDPIQRYFGVEIKDLGCCKAVGHKLFGTKVFIGTLFTNAPTDSPIMKKILAPSGME